MTDDALGPYRADAPLGEEERDLLEDLPPMRSGNWLRRSVTKYWLRRSVTNFLAAPDRPEPGEVTDLSSALNGLAVQLVQEGRYPKALGAAALATRITLSVLGEEHPDTLTSLNNLAYCLQALGRNAEALTHYKRTLAASRRTLGETHLQTIQCQNNLGYCLQPLGRIDEALEHFEAALATSRRVLGEKDPLTLQIRNNVGHCLLAKGRAKDALPHFEETLVSLQQVPGKEHPNTILTLMNLAGCLQALGRYDEALPRYQEALTGCRTVLGETHPQTLVVRSDLAYCLQAMGRAVEALPLYEAVLSARQLLMGELHPQTIVSLHLLAGCLFALGRYEAALPYARAALEGGRQALGEEHPNTIGIRGSLAGCLLALGQTGEALEHYQTTLTASRRILGDEHPQTLVSENNLAIGLQALDRADEALPHFRGALASFRRILGEEHPDTLKSLNNLAYCMLKLGHLDQALEQFQAGLFASRRVLGDEHPDTLRTLSNVAGCLQALERFDEARLHFETAVMVRERALGQAHPDTLKSLNNLAYCLEGLGRSEEAAARWRAMSLALGGLPQPGGDWLELLAHTVGSVAEHARAGRLSDWPELFAGLRETLAETMDLLDAEQWVVARADVALFHGTYLALCLDLGRSDLVPAALAGVQGRRLAALVLEELDRRAEGADPESLPARYRKVRLELRRLALRLQVVPGSQPEPLGAPQRSAEAEATLQRARVETYMANLAEYRELLVEYRKLRAEIAAADPAQVGGAPSFAPTLAELQAGLGREAALVLLLMRQDPAAAGTVVAVVIRPASAETVSLGQLVLAQGSETGAWEWRPGAVRWQRGRRFTAPEGFCQEVEPAASDDPGADDLPQAPAVDQDWNEWLRAQFWTPLADDLQGVGTLHLVTQGALHALPFEAGAPAHLRIVTYPGLVYYHRLLEAAPPPALLPGGGLAVLTYGAEDTRCPIPLVGVEQVVLQRLWPGSITGQAADHPAVGCLHVAGHGEFDPRDPTQARVWLGPGETLGFNEVLALQRVPPLVFLSACVVGRTHEDPVDGDPLGLVGALFLRGARYVIGPLQPVADLLMPVLVTLFYQSWCQQGLPPAEALAEAKRRMGDGDWYVDTATLLREEYGTVVDAWAERVVLHGSDDDLYWLIVEWFPDLHGDWAQSHALRDHLADPARRALALTPRLDWLMGREWLADAEYRSAVENLVTWVRGFGLGDAPGD